MQSTSFRTPDGEIVDPDYRNLFNLASVGTDGPVTLSFVPTGAGADGAYQKVPESTFV